MPETQGLKKRTPDIILDLFRDNFQGIFKLYRIGDPIIFGESVLPAICITEPTTKYDFGPTGFDDIVHELLLQIIFNKKDELNKPSSAATLDEVLDDIVQGRDEITGDFMPQTVMGVLRKNITLGNLYIENIGQVEKGMIPRSDTLITQEAHIRLTLTELQSVANRT